MYVWRVVLCLKKNVRGSTPPPHRRIMVKNKKNKSLDFKSSRNIFHPPHKPFSDIDSIHSIHVLIRCIWLTSVKRWLIPLVGKHISLKVKKSKYVSTNYVFISIICSCNTKLVISAKYCPNPDRISKMLESNVKILLSGISSRESLLKNHGLAAERVCIKIMV